MRRWRRRALIAVLGVVGLALAGLGFQSIATAIDASRFPAPGRVIDVGGFPMHIACQGTAGTGQPTIVLEHGEGGWSSAWYLIQPELSRVTRTCAYDRAGLGWSEESRAPRDAKNIAQELRTLLAKADVSPPYVMVGYSFGGLYAREFTHLYRQDVIGVVLIDSTHPDYFTATPQGRSDFQMYSNIYAGARLLAPFGILRFIPTPLTSIPQTLPGEKRAQWAALVDTTRYWNTTAAEFAATAATCDEVRNTDLQGLPLAIVTTPLGDKLHADEQLDLARLSTNSFMVEVAGTDHASLWSGSEGAAATTSAIKRVVAAAATGADLATG